MNYLEEINEVQESRTFHQCGILLLDGSGSMERPSQGNISLAESVDRSVREFLGYFKGSSMANNFSFAVITFDHQASIHLPKTELSEVDDFGNYNPYSQHGGGTNIGAALELAEEIALSHLESPEARSVPHDVRIIIMSDGLCQHPVNTREVAERIKRNEQILICSTLFTDRAQITSDEIQEAKSLLAELVSMPNLYKTTYSETDLRQFFVSSMSAKRVGKSK